MKNKLAITDKSISPKTATPFVAVYIPEGGRKPKPIVIMVTELSEASSPRHFRGYANIIESPIHKPGERISIGGPEKSLRRIEFTILKEAVGVNAHLEGIRGME